MSRSPHEPLSNFGNWISQRDHKNNMVSYYKLLLSIFFFVLINTFHKGEKDENYRSAPCQRNDPCPPTKWLCETPRLIGHNSPGPSKRPWLRCQSAPAWVLVRLLMKVLYTGLVQMQELWRVRGHIHLANQNSKQNLRVEVLAIFLWPRNNYGASINTRATQ